MKRYSNRNLKTGTSRRDYFESHQTCKVTAFVQEKAEGRQRSTQQTQELQKTNGLGLRATVKGHAHHSTEFSKAAARPEEPSVVWTLALDSSQKLCPFQGKALH